MAFETHTEPSMVEDEVRIPGIDAKRLITLLEREGAQCIFAGHICDHIFDTQKRSLSRKLGLKIRARQSVTLDGTEVHELTLKSKIKSEKERTRVRESDPVFFASLEIAKRHADSFIKELVLEGIVDLRDQSVDAEIRRKTRAQYALGSLSFEVDRLRAIKMRGRDEEITSFVPWYVDIEIKYPHDASQEEIGRLHAERQSYIKRFSLVNKDGAPEKTSGMIDFYRLRQ